MPIRGYDMHTQENAKDDINNYRPITLTNIVYKISEAIMSQGVNTILNLLTEGGQYPYNSRRSTIGTLATVSSQLRSDAAREMIIFRIL